jgi:zinc protease
MIRAITTLFVLLIAALPARAATDIQEFVTPGGVTVWLVEEHSIPIVAFELNFRGGGSLDPKGKEGAAYLMAATLEEGAGDMNAQEFLQATETLAARFSYDTYRDSVAISAQMLSENMRPSIELLRTALLDPTFDDTAVTRVREQVLSSLRSDATDPNEIAGTRLRELSYPDHPYGVPVEGTLETVSALTPDDLRAAHAATLVKSRAYVGVVGDITPQVAAEMVDRLIGDLPNDGPPMPERATMAVGKGTTVVELDVPQSVAIFGHEGIEREDDDYLAAYVLNEIFGGSGLQSRLQQEVREKRGLSYGVYSFLAPMDHGAQVMGSFSSANDRIAEAIDIIRSEWARISSEGVTAEELEAAKLYLTGAYPLRFDSNSKIAGNLVGMQAVGLPLDYVKTRNDQVNALTLEQVNRVAKTLYRPEELHIVVVGKPEGVATE